MGSFHPLANRLTYDGRTPLYHDKLQLKYSDFNDNNVISAKDVVLEYTVGCGAVWLAHPVSEKAAVPVPYWHETGLEKGTVRAVIKHMFKCRLIHGIPPDDKLPDPSVLNDTSEIKASYGVFKVSYGDNNEFQEVIKYSSSKTIKAD